MPWVGEEEIQAAKRMSAYEYLRKYDSGRLKKSSARNEWELTDHDSFKINALTSKWHWKSRGIGGVTALKFLTRVDGMEFTEAVRLLCGESPSCFPRETAEPEKKPFQLPFACQNCSRVRKYLNGRGISNSVITYCIQMGILYESAPWHNAVFVGMDKGGTPRYAFLRGIYDQNGKSFQLEPSGSEKKYAFCVPPLGKSSRVAVYEACVDLLAHMTLEDGRADKYRLALGGISAPKEGQIREDGKRPQALEYFLSVHPEIEEIEICMDNDFAGRNACEQIQKAYEGKYRMIENLPGIEGADYGDMAKEALQKRQVNEKNEKNEKNPRTERER